MLAKDFGRLADRIAYAILLRLMGWILSTGVDWFTSLILKRFGTYFAMRSYLIRIQLPSVFLICTVVRLFPSYSIFNRPILIIALNLASSSILTLMSRRYPISKMARWEATFTDTSHIETLEVKAHRSSLLRISLALTTDLIISFWSHIFTLSNNFLRGFPNFLLARRALVWITYFGRAVLIGV